MILDTKAEANAIGDTSVAGVDAAIGGDKPEGGSVVDARTT